MEVAPGTWLGPYQIVSRIGSGGMGEVWHARDSRLDRSVAIKVLPNELASKPRLKERFEREARAISKLNHPNICTLHDVGEGYLVMELLEGETLAQRIARGRVSMKDALTWGAQLADALEVLHRAGIVHRDLKPGNVMITSAGVKLLDFGLARISEPVSDDAPTAPVPLTTEGTIVGTLQYMSPEQLDGKPTGPGTDIFSFGCVLYEMLAGRRAFDGLSQTSIIVAIMTTEPPPLASLVPLSAPALQHLVSKCLAKDPAERWRSAHDIAGELRWLADGGSSPARMPLVSVDVPRSRARRGAMLALCVAVAALGSLWIWQRSRASVPEAPRPESAVAAVPARTIAVLPFENLGAPEDEYFAAGLTEEITSRLAAVRDLRVMSRTSVVAYDRRGKSVRQIGRELGVAYILEGSVRWEKGKQGDRIRVTPQLIRTADDTHLWADRFDRTLESVFEVQAEVGEKVTDQLGVTLVREEQEAIRARPTNSMEAYDLYLQANAMLANPNKTNGFGRCIELYENATLLDTGFVAAHANLGTAHLHMYHMGLDRQPSRLDAAKRSIDRALALDDRSPEAHVAMAYYHYWGFLDYDRAFGQLEIAQRLRPNDEEVVTAMGYVVRRRGELERSLGYFTAAHKLNPGNAVPHDDLAVTLVCLRRHAEADQNFLRAIALQPDNLEYRREALFNRVAWQGLSNDAALLAAPLQSGSDMESTWTRYYLAMLERDATKAVSVLESSEVAIFAGGSHLPRELLLGRAYALAGDREAAARSFEAARRILERSMREKRDEPRVLMALAMAEAGLGREHDAILHAERAVALYPLSRDALLGAVRLQDLAQVYAAAGQRTKALDIIERLLSIPSELTPHYLALDPAWDLLREEPRFKRLADGARGKASG
jgi:TolB-like protein